MKSEQIIALIPARGGSKRIPNKNIRLFVEQPIISFSIRAAQETGLFDKIIVSTDSQEIARISKEYGAEIPFIRPTELADDFTGTDEVVLHAISWFQNQNITIKYICCIYATAPFIQPEYIKKGFELLREEQATSCFSVTTFPSSIFRALKINENDRLEMINPQYLYTRSQDLPQTYHDAGQFYWADVKKYSEEKKICSRDAVPIIIPRYLVQDIDTLEDWKRAELMYRILQSEGLVR